jgi:hypothetical protein
MEPLNKNEKAPESSFDEVKESATSVVGGLTEKLRRLDDAMTHENMGASYHIYWNELPEAIQQSANKNHEIDDFFSKKIHKEFAKKFPFMRLGKRVSPIFLAYFIDQYYRERRTIQIDAAKPEILILPTVKDYWLKVESGAVKKEIEGKQIELDQLNANSIAAKSKLDTINAELSDALQKQEEINSNKGFFNRRVADEELGAVEEQISTLKAEQSKWQPYLKANDQDQAQQTTIVNEMNKMRLKEAVALKELRLIKKHFGSLQEMETQFTTFIAEFLGEEGK